jgi:glycosyltransferase involved in cell wall biosynthesis
MRILFVTSYIYLPQDYNGMISHTHQLGTGLQERGHHVAVLGGFELRGLLAWQCSLQKKILRRHFSKDMYCSYPVWRARQPWDEVDSVAEKEKPDLIVVMAGEPVRMALAAKKTGRPILMRLHDVEFDSFGGRFEDLGDVPCVANSRFTAGKYHAAFGVTSTLIYPFIDASRYKTNTTRENVTFINPVPQKGFDIALGVAHLCPEIPFVFVEGWHLDPQHRTQISGHLSRLPNVTLIPARGDMRSVYGKSKILLAPSIWEEAYGRVVTEAQFSGIPVVASTRGGLPEAVGRGGVLLDPAQPVTAWANAVRKMWHDRRLRLERLAPVLAGAAGRTSRWMATGERRDLLGP